MTASRYWFGGFFDLLKDVPKVAFQNWAKDIETRAMLPVTTVQAMFLATPPVSPTAGQAWIVAHTGATGVWATKADQLAVWQLDQTGAGSWQYYVPTGGEKVYNAVDGLDYRFSGATWAVVTGGASSGGTAGGASGQVQVNAAGALAGVTVSGDATMSATGVLTLAANAVTNAKAAVMAAFTVKANNTNASAAPIDLSLSAVLDIIFGVSAPARGTLLFRGASLWTALAPGAAGQVLTSGGAGADLAYAVPAVSVADTAIQDFRLTCLSGAPVPTSDVTAATSVYLTPYTGDRIALFDGTSVWTVLSSAEVALSLGTLAAGFNYDVFAFNNAGAVALEALVWTNDTTRATALVRVNGVWCKSGATTRRYVGTFRTSAIGQTADTAGGSSTASLRFVWNVNNRVRRLSNVWPAASSWTYTPATTWGWRKQGADANAEVRFVAGLTEDQVDLTATASTSTSVASSQTAISVALNWTSGANSTPSGGGATVTGAIGAPSPLCARGGKLAALGFNTANALEANQVNSVQLTTNQMVNGGVFSAGLLAVLNG